MLVLRELGADVAWHLPSRFEEGYGVSRQTLERLADDGVGLVLTVDCGITAVEEIAEAKARGLEVVVTDHHRPGDVLPDCPIVATRPSSYPFPELCGTGVVYKLGEALLGADHPALRRNLDLVALATIADVVPLVDENRALATAGLRALAATSRPGLQALMRSAHVDPATVDSGSVGFRLAPRINAAGRLGRPDVALELVLTDDPDEARRHADVLEELNRDRQAVEDRILRDADRGRGRDARAEAATARLRPLERGLARGRDRDRRVATRRAVPSADRPHHAVARRAGRARDGRSRASTCTARSPRARGVSSASAVTVRPQGCRSTRRTSRRSPTTFAAHADANLGPEDLFETIAVDAVVSARDLTLDLAEELERLAPFGLGNPDVTLLVPATEAVTPATVGDGKHLRFRVRQHGRDAGSAIAFGQGSQLDRLRAVGLFDVAFRLKENHWNGTVAPQLVVRRIFDTAEGYEELRAAFAELWRRGEPAWTPEARRVFGELALDAEGAGRGQLLESESFRALLLDAALPRAA